MKMICTLLVALILFCFEEGMLADDIRQLHLATEDIVYDSLRQTIYASVPRNVGSIPDTIVPIDPVTGAIGRPINIGSKPGRLAISDDGQFLYVATDEGTTIRRLNLASQTVDLQFSLGSEGGFGSYYVWDMKVMPGNPSAIAVSRRFDGYGYLDAGVAIYDDGVQRIKTARGSFDRSVIDFSDSASTLYGLSHEGVFRKLAVDISGVSILQETPGLVSSYSADIHFNHGLIYSTSGHLIDPVVPELLGRYADYIEALVMPDCESGRVFLLTDYYSSETVYTAKLRAYVQHTFLPVATVDIPGISGTPHSLIRWGKNGLAFRTSEYDQVFLIRTSLLSSASSTGTIPVVVDSGGNGGAHFSSQLTLSNRGDTTASVQLSYTAASALNASGGGQVSETLAPGQQLVISDALSYLRSKGLPIPITSSQGGSLRVDFSNLASSEVAFAGARTTAPSGPGRSGLSYSALTHCQAASGPVYLFGLRQTTSDRTNLALVNTGRERPLTLRVTLYSGQAGDSRRVTVSPEITLGPGQWKQLNSVLNLAGFQNGYAKIERISGIDPYLAYAVFNDNFTNDGSYVSSIAASRPVGQQLLPVVVETGKFQSELVLANPSSKRVDVALSYVESLASPTGPTGTVTEALEPGEQKIIAGALHYLRSKGSAIGPLGGNYAGTLSVSFTAAGLPLDGFIGARTASPVQGAGQYGLFYAGVSFLESAVNEGWIFGLEQNSSTRSNLGVANVGSTGGSITLQYDVYDGTTGLKTFTSDPFMLGPGGWTQINGVLANAGLSNGYVHVRKISGDERFWAYGVINDGADSSSGTNDGSYVALAAIQ